MVPCKLIYNTQLIFNIEKLIQSSSNIDLKMFITNSIIVQLKPSRMRDNHLKIIPKGRTNHLLSDPYQHVPNSIVWQPNIIYMFS